MTQVVVHPNLAALPRPNAGRIPVLLYGTNPHINGSGAIGNPVWDRVSRVQAALNPIAFDFLSLSMAVTAADTFVNRDEAPDGWARKIDLSVALADPQRWQPVIPTLERALSFLSGDEWSLEVVGGGELPPPPRARVQDKVSLAGCDSACLYSGGLDSAIGVLDLRSQGRNPVLVSHGYTRDAGRQVELLRHLGAGLSRFATSAAPAAWLGRGNDVQMRTRSFNFLAMGALMASALGPQRTTLFVPENGLIALNPPLTNRRIGALSTRTTHPHYLHLVQQVWEAVGLNVALDNPYARMTKGEMMGNCAEQASLARIAPRSVSCGKWKRTGLQCGRCVPCLIRRASFHAAGWVDRTVYSPAGGNLARFFRTGNETDDLMAMILAARRLDEIDMESWVAKTGPLPISAQDRQQRVAAVHRGMIEVRDFLVSKNLL